jgi:hypothetical protein
MASLLGDDGVMNLTRLVSASMFAKLHRRVINP